jgi:hypothetical protein
MEVSFTANSRRQTARRTQHFKFRYATIASKIMGKEEVYELAVANGEWPLHMMLASDYEAGHQLDPPQNTTQSVFNLVQDSIGYGYTELPWNPIVGDCALDGLEPVFEAIGADAKLAEDGGRNVRVDYKHTVECIISRIQYRVSLLQFANQNAY